MEDHQLAKILELKKEREQNLKSIKIKSTGEDRSDKAVELVLYKVNLSREDISFIDDYIYTMTQKTGRIYRKSDAIKDAVASLRDNFQMNLLTNPRKNNL